jgi:hypothetical protein
MSIEPLDVRQVRLARNQALFRAVNERVEHLSLEFLSTETHHSFVCECSDLGCATQLELTHEEYEEIRRGPASFLIASGHQLGVVEVVVEEHPRYTVVEKIQKGRDVAEATYPRGNA